MTRAGPTDIYPVKASHRARAYVRRGPHINGDGARSERTRPLLQRDV